MAQAMFVHDGASIDHTPGADVTAGEVIVQGELVGVAKTPIAANAVGSLAVVGVFDFPKATGVGTAITAGATVYWDDVGDMATIDDGAGVNKLIGKCVMDAADADATVRIRMMQ